MKFIAINLIFLLFVCGYTAAAATAAAAAPPAIESAAATNLDKHSRLGLWIICQYLTFVQSRQATDLSVELSEEQLNQPGQLNQPADFRAEIVAGAPGNQPEEFRRELQLLMSELLEKQAVSAKILEPLAPVLREAESEWLADSAGDLYRAEMTKVLFKSYESAAATKTELLQRITQSFFSTHFSIPDSKIALDYELPQGFEVKKQNGSYQIIPVGSRKFPLVVFPVRFIITCLGIDRNSELNPDLIRKVPLGETTIWSSRNLSLTAMDDSLNLRDFMEDYGSASERIRNVDGITSILIERPEQLKFQDGTYYFNGQPLNLQISEQVISQAVKANLGLNVLSEVPIYNLFANYPLRLLHYVIGRTITLGEIDDQKLELELTSRPLRRNSLNFNSPDKQPGNLEIIFPAEGNWIIPVIDPDNLESFKYNPDTGNYGGILIDSQNPWSLTFQLSYQGETIFTQQLNSDQTKIIQTDNQIYSGSASGGPGLSQSPGQGPVITRVEGQQPAFPGIMLSSHSSGDNLFIDLISPAKENFLFDSRNGPLPEFPPPSRIFYNRPNHQLELKLEQPIFSFLPGEYQLEIIEQRSAMLLYCRNLNFNSSWSDWRPVEFNLFQNLKSSLIDSGSWDNISINNQTYQLKLVPDPAGRQRKEQISGRIIDRSTPAVDREAIQTSNHYSGSIIPLKLTILDEYPEVRMGAEISVYWPDQRDNSPIRQSLLSLINQQLADYQFINQAKHKPSPDRPYPHFLHQFEFDFPIPEDFQGSGAQIRLFLFEIENNLRINNSPVLEINLPEIRDIHPPLISATLVYRMTGSDGRTVTVGQSAYNWISFSKNPESQTYNDGPRTFMYHLADNSAQPRMDLDYRFLPSGKLIADSYLSKSRLYRLPYVRLPGSVPLEDDFYKPTVLSELRLPHSETIFVRPSTAAKFEITVIDNHQPVKLTARLGTRYRDGREIPEITKILTSRIEIVNIDFQGAFGLVRDEIFSLLLTAEDAGGNISSFELPVRIISEQADTRTVGYSHRRDIEVDSGLFTVHQNSNNSEASIFSELEQRIIQRENYGATTVQGIFNFD